MTPEQIFDRSMPEPNSGCWLWMGALDKDGYGTVVTRPRHIAAHRLSYQLHCGEIPPGECVLHSCDQPCCVNPDHLRLGSHQDNSDDRARRGRTGWGFGENHGCAKITEEMVRSIRADTRSGAAIGRSYGISASQANRIKGRQYWAHVA